MRAYLAMVVVAVVGISSSAAAATKQFLLANFVCTENAPLPSLSATKEAHLHEFRDVKQTDHQVCAYVEAFQILGQGPAPLQRQCRTYNLVSYTVMCRGGPVSAARWYAAHPKARSAGVAIEGDELMVGFSGGGGWRIGRDTPGVTGLNVARRSTTMASLPHGWGFSLNLPVRHVSLPWTEIAAGTAITVSRPAKAALPDVALPAWVALFKTWWP